MYGNDCNDGWSNCSSSRYVDPMILRQAAVKEMNESGKLQGRSDYWMVLQLCFQSWRQLQKNIWLNNLMLKYQLDHREQVEDLKNSSLVKRI